MTVLFKKFQHIERLGNVEVHNILEDDLDRYIFPKIDGTNASIWKNDEGKLSYGSRNRELSIESDNKGFCNFIENNLSEKFYKLLDRLENMQFIKDNIIHPVTKKNGWVVLYGEWLVPHTIKSYTDDAWRKFYIFDIAIRWEDDSNPIYLPFNESLLNLFKEIDVDFIPPIKIYKKGQEVNINDIIHLSRNVSFLMQEDFFGEGIVIKKYGYRNKFGRTTWAKVVNENFGVIKKIKDNSPNEIKPIVNTIEYELVEKYITTQLISKEKEKISNNNDGWNNKYLPLLFQSVLNSFIEDDLKTVINNSKKNKPIINFQQFYNLIIEKVKNTIL